MEVQNIEENNKEDSEAIGKGEKQVGMRRNKWTEKQMGTWSVKWEGEETCGKVK